MSEDLELVLMENQVHPTAKLIDDLERWAADRLGAAIRRLPPSSDQATLEGALCGYPVSLRQSAAAVGISHVNLLRRVRRLRKRLGLPPSVRG